MSWSRASRTVETLLEVAEQLLIWSSRAAMFADSRETPSSAARNSSGVLRVRSASVVSDSRELVGVDLLGGLGEAGERLDDVVRRAGALDRDLRALVQLAGAGRLEREEHRAEQGLHLDRGAGVGAEVGVGLDPEGDLDVVAVELDRLDLADADAGDPDLVVGLEPAGLG